MPVQVKINYKELALDHRFKELNNAISATGLEFVLVKGTVWNRGQLLTGSDIDFYVRNEGGEPEDFSTLPQQVHDLVERLFPGVLVVPRVTDADPPIRIGKYWVDAEMTLGETQATLSFGNPESEMFFETGLYKAPNTFGVNRDQVIFALNRCLEVGGSWRRIEEVTYRNLISFASSHNPLYHKMLLSFSNNGGEFAPPTDLPYLQLAKSHLSTGGAREDLFYIKPLNKARMTIEGTNDAVGR